MILVVPKSAVTARDENTVSVEVSDEGLSRLVAEYFMATDDAPLSEEESADITAARSEHQAGATVAWRNMK